MTRATQDIEITRSLPSDMNLEQSVLGACLIDRTGLPIVADMLKPETFHYEAHREVFAVLLSIFKEGGAIEPMTVYSKLQRTGSSVTASGLAEFTTRVTSSANIEAHARRLKELEVRRNIIIGSQRAAALAYDYSADVFDTLTELENNVVHVDLGSGGTYGVDQIAKENHEAYVSRSKIKGLHGVPSGLASLDRKLGGFKNQDLYIIAARPSMGKSALMLSIASNAALRFDKRVLIFSLEMGRHSLTDRLTAMEARINARGIQDAKLGIGEAEKYEATIEGLSNIKDKLFINDTSGLLPMQVKAEAMKLRSRVGRVDMILIDYLQLMTSPLDGRKSTNDQVGEISKQLKGIAKALDVPVVVLSQLSRAVEKRGGDKRPILSDLRDSGNIEQDADVIMFPYRPEYYGIMEDAEGTSTQGRVELIIAKNRNGETGMVNLRFTKELTLFTDWDEAVYEVPNNETKYSQIGAVRTPADGEEVPF